MCVAVVHAIHPSVAEITAADFVVADVTDAMLDGVIAGCAPITSAVERMLRSCYSPGFPNTYASKVGKTSDSMYKAYAD